MQLSLSTLLSHIPFDRFTMCPNYLKEISPRSLLRDSISHARIHPLASSRPYHRRSLTTVPMHFTPKSLVLTLCPVHGVLGRGLGGRHQNFSPRISISPWQAGRGQSLLSHPECMGKAVGQWARPPASNCIALQ